jgi:hypothetical protein
MAAGFPMAITTNRNGSTTLGISLLIIADGVTNQRYFKQIQFPGHTRSGGYTAIALSAARNERTFSSCGSFRGW